MATKDVNTPTRDATTPGGDDVQTPSPRSFRLPSGLAGWAKRRAKVEGIGLLPGDENRGLTTQDGHGSLVERALADVDREGWDAFDLPTAGGSEWRVENARWETEDQSPPPELNRHAARLTDELGVDTTDTTDQAGQGTGGPLSTIVRGWARNELARELAERRGEELPPQERDHLLTMIEMDDEAAETGRLVDRIGSESRRVDTVARTLEETNGV